LLAIEKFLKEVKNLALKDLVLVEELVADGEEVIGTLPLDLQKFHSLIMKKSERGKELSKRKALAQAATMIHQKFGETPQGLSVITPEEQQELDDLLHLISIAREMFGYEVSKIISGGYSAFELRENFQIVSCPSPCHEFLGSNLPGFLKAILAERGFSIVGAG
jgi:hypothetical protein